MEWYLFCRFGKGERGGIGLGTGLDSWIVGDMDVFGLQHFGAWLE